jgi:hypothetical protein
MPVFIQMDTLNREDWIHHEIGGLARHRKFSPYRRVRRRAYTERGETTIPFVGQGPAPPSGLLVAFYRTGWYCSHCGHGATFRYDAPTKLARYRFSERVA